MYGRKQKKGFKRESVLNTFRTMRARKQIDEFNLALHEEVSSDESEDDDEENELGLINYENKLTNRIWLPQEPRLFMIFSGSRFISY